MTSSSWNPPCWSQIPPSTQQWHLDELKNGILLATHSLNNLLSSPHTNARRCITFGRIENPSQIDILTAHESCSRLHARIAFTSSGIPYLKDLGSGNGTFVNNRQLPPEACGKWECTDEKVKEVRGSRGVVLYPGDAIRFGCSTRIFVLEGPEEFERGAMRVGNVAVVGNSDNQDGAVASNAAAVVVEAKAKEEVCTWGMSTDDNDEQQDEQLQQQSASQSNNNTNTSNLPSIETFFTTPTTKYTISNTLQQLYNQYQSKSHKLNTISTESKRISQKEEMGVELTDGQRNQLVKNQEKLTALERSMRELKEKIEEGMSLAIHGKVLNNRPSTRKRDDGYGEEDDVDDFFDRTAINNLSSKRQRHSDQEEDEVESESSLIQKWKLLIQSHSKQQTLISSKMKQRDKLQRQIDNSAAGDEEDAFFLQNDLNLVMEDVKKATSRLEDMEHDLKGVERLLKIVNPKLSWDRGLGLIGTELDIDAKKSEYKELEADNAATDVANEQDESIMMMPPPPKTATAVTTSADSFDMPPPPVMMPIAAAKHPLSSDMMPPPPKVTMGVTESTPTAAEKRDITEHAINPDRATPQEKGEQSLPPPKKKRQLGPMRPPPTTAGSQGTLAALQQFNSSNFKEASSSNSHAKKHKKSNNDNQAVFDPRKDEWNAPSDQDGSGRTSLHDKFKGRY